MWGATGRKRANNSKRIFQSTLPVWGATLLPFRNQSTPAISIHAPRVGSDTKGGIHILNMDLFQSTLPVWGATNPWAMFKRGFIISIHAPRVGSDGNMETESTINPDFNPRSPCGERPTEQFSYFVGKAFQSTLPVWGATHWK